VATGIALIEDGTLLPDMGIRPAARRGRLAIGGFVGFALGTAVGFSRIAGVLLDRTILMLRAIPFLAVLPLVIVWLGIGEGAKVFLVAFGVAFPIYMNTVLGIRQVDPKLVGTRPRHRPVELAVDSPHHPAWRAAVDPQRDALCTRHCLAGTRRRRNDRRQFRHRFLAMDAREFLRTDVIVLVIIIYAVIGVRRRLTGSAYGAASVGLASPTYASEARR